MRQCFLGVIMVVVILLGSAAFAGGDFGPSAPFGKEGQISLGLGYHYYSSDWKNDTPEIPVSEYTRNLFYLQLGYTFVEGWEAYVRLGFADAKFKQAYPLDHRFDFKDGYKPAFGFGLRGLARDGTWRVGPIVQMNLYSGYDHLEEGEVGYQYASANLMYDDTWDLALGVCFGYDTGVAVLSLAPYLFWSKSKATLELTIEGPTDTFTGDLEEKNVVGGMFGAFLPLGSGLSLNVETQYQSKFSFSISVAETFGGK